MKRADVRIGGIYLARVSGRIVPVKILRTTEVNAIRYDGAETDIVSVTKFVAENTVTGREVIVSAARLRCEVFMCQQCNKKLSAYRMKADNRLGLPAGTHICRDCLDAVRQVSMGYN